VLTPEQQALVEQNLGLAYYWARYYRFSPLLFQELLSIAFESLVISARDHDPSKGSSFATYASKRIKFGILNEILRAKSLNELEYLDAIGGYQMELFADIESNHTKELEAIKEYLRNFPGTQREKAAAIMFIRNPSLPQTEIAQMTGVCQKTVSTSITKLRRQLQAKLTG
jgi:RNA polymerase sigma factor (sigma-70 family)